MLVTASTDKVLRVFDLNPSARAQPLPTLTEDHDNADNKSEVVPPPPPNLSTLLREVRNAHAQENEKEEGESPTPLQVQLQLNQIQEGEEGREQALSGARNLINNKKEKTKLKTAALTAVATSSSPSLKRLNHSHRKQSLKNNLSINQSFSSKPKGGRATNDAETASGAETAQTGFPVRSLACSSLLGLAATSDDGGGLAIWDLEFMK